VSGSETSDKSTAVSAVSAVSAAADAAPEPADTAGADPAGADTAGADTAGAAATASPWNDPRMPWNGRPRKVDILCWAAIMLSAVYYYALLPFRAHLVGTHPVWSELLNGSTESIIAAAAFARIGHGTLIVAFIAALPGLIKFDWLYWWAGRLWGDKFILLLSGKSKRGTKYMDRVHRWGRKFTYPAVILSPFMPLAAVIFVLAGWSGMRLITFLLLDLVGNMLWAGLLCGLGYALGHHAVVIAEQISHYGLWVTIGLVVVIMFFQIRSQRGMMRVAREEAVALHEDAAAHREDPAAGQVAGPPAGRATTGQPVADGDGS
jgi:membrane-associated protein